MVRAMMQSKKRDVIDDEFTFETVLDDIDFEVVDDDESVIDFEAVISP